LRRRPSFSGPPLTLLNNEAPSSKKADCLDIAFLRFIERIGLLVAVLSILTSINSMMRSHCQRAKVLDLYDAKLNACRFLAGPKALPWMWKD
jgi:hypothetical protein